MGKRRMNGEGSLYKRKSDGLWVGSVQVGFTQHGTRDRRTVYGRTKDEAQEKKKALERQRDAGVDLTKRATVGDYMDAWLSMKRERVAARTHELYTTYVGRARGRLGRLELTKVTPVMIQGVIDKIAKDSGASTANKVRAVLFGMFKQAVRWRLLPSNPVEGVDKLKETPQPIKLWTNEEAARFLDTARSHRLYALYYVMLSTAVRKGEIEALRWGDLHGDHLIVMRTVSRVANKITYSSPKTVNGHRVVNLPPDVLEVLEAHRQRQAAEAEAAGDAFNDQGLMFCNQDGNVITPMALYHVTKRLQERAGVPKVTMHSLRHLSISMMIRHGVNAEIVADRVGHRDGAYTYRQYTHVFHESRREAAVPMTDLLKGSGPLN